ncbi:MAG: DUF6427 family protein [Bacteroidales bacterium]|nr:DUF6427 family protein [Bacteroidales bacterium]
MLKIIQSNFILQMAALVAVLVWTVLQIVGFSLLPTPEGTYWIFDLNMLNNTNIVNIVLLSGLLFLFIVLTDIYYFRCGFADKHHFMIFVFSLLAMSSIGIASFLSPLGFSMLLMVLLLMLNYNYDSGNVKCRDLFSGILIAMACLFYFPCIFLSFFVVSSLIINKYSKTKDILAFLIGILLVIVYLFSYFYFTDNVSGLLSLIPGLKLSNCFDATKIWSWREILLLTTTGIALLYGIVVDKIHFDTQPIALRKRMATINVMTISCILMFVFSPYDIKQSVVFLMLPIIFYFTILSQLNKNRLVNDFIVLLYIVSLCL